jgi:hypothetical protein
LQFPGFNNGRPAGLAGGQFLIADSFENSRAGYGSSNGRCFNLICEGGGHFLRLLFRPAEYCGLEQKLSRRTGYAHPTMASNGQQLIIGY